MTSCRARVNQPCSAGQDPDPHRRRHTHMAVFMEPGVRSRGRRRTAWAPPDVSCARPGRFLIFPATRTKSSKRPKSAVEGATAGETLPGDVTRGKAAWWSVQMSQVPKGTRAGAALALSVCLHFGFTCPSAKFLYSVPFAL